MSPSKLHPPAMIPPSVPGSDRDEEFVRPPGRPRDERASRAILGAARRQLTELGYAGISMESVAGEAAVGRTTIYRRYRDKADLVTSAIAEGIEPFPEELPADARAAVVQFLERLEVRLGGECFEVLTSLFAAREDPHALALHRDRVIAQRNAYLRALLERARDDGEIARDADLDLALEMLIGSVFARRITGAPARAGWATRAVAAIWAGMAPPAG